MEDTEKEDILLSPTTKNLSEYMAAAKTATLPPEVILKAKFHILDTLAAMISGIVLLPGRRAIAFVNSLDASEEACIPGSNLFTSAIHAALANGMTAHADETDDSHAPSFSHPGCAVIPAALAMAERERRSGTSLLRAVVLGYDIGSRVTMTLGVHDYSHRGHKSTHTVAANFGAHAAAGSLADFDAQRMRWLLAYAAQQASGTNVWQRDKEHIQKAFDFGGMAARNGVYATLMVKAGCSGVDDVFSGQHNYFDAYAPDADPRGMVRELGEIYEIMNANLKKWAVGSPIQAPLDSFQHLIIENDLSPADVAHVSVRVADAEARVVDNRDMPDICLQHVLALMLLDRTASFHALHDYERMNDPSVLRERAKIELIPDAELAKALPRRQAMVEITTADGQIFHHRTDDVRGTVANPMTQTEVEDKARDLLIPTLGKARTQALIDTVWEIEKLDDVHTFRPFLQVGETL